MVQLCRRQAQNSALDHVQLFSSTIQQRCQLVVQFSDVLDHQAQNIGKEVSIGLIQGFLSKLTTQLQYRRFIDLPLIGRLSQRTPSLTAGPHIGLIFRSGRLF